MATRADGALLADIGGTNVRFAHYQGGSLGPITRFKVVDYPGPADAIEAYLAQTSYLGPPRTAVLAVAGPVTSHVARLTNGSWEFSAPTLRSVCGFERVEIVNDFAAVALGLPLLKDKDREQLGGRHGISGAPLAVLGPGTGLGVAALLSPNNVPLVIASEGGHTTLPVLEAYERAMLEGLYEDLGHVAAEDILSGPGLETLYNCIAAQSGAAARPRKPEEIVRAALTADCPTSRATIEQFCKFLGRFAGDITLTFGARGGTYLTGSIAASLVDYLKKSSFRQQFEAKGSFENYLADIPCYIVTKEDPAFLGLAAIVAKD